MQPFYGGCKVQLNARISIATNSKDNKVCLIYIVIIIGKFVSTW